MSCCSGNCGCGSGCKCGNGCGGCGMYPDVEKATTATIIHGAGAGAGAAPKKMFSEGSEMSIAAQGGNACKCGPNCDCKL